MARHLKVGAAQLGPIHKADSRESAVRRMMALMQDAHAAGCALMVYPELALTTFFPRYWYDDVAAIDGWFERAMPSEATRPLFDLAAQLKIGFYLGYAELAQEAGAARRFNTSILVGPDGRIIGKYRKVHLPGHIEHKEGRALPASREALFRDRRPRLPGIPRLRRHHRHADLQRPTLARGLSGDGAAGRRDGPARLQHAHPQHLPPRAALPAHVPQPALRAGRRLSERHLGRGHGQGWCRGRLWHARRLLYRGAGRRDRGAGDQRRGRAHHLRLRPRRRPHYKNAVFAFDKHRRIEHYGLITSQTGVVLPPE